MRPWLDAFTGRRVAHRQVGLSLKKLSKGVGVWGSGGNGSERRHSEPPSVPQPAPRLKEIRCSNPARLGFLSTVLLLCSDWNAEGSVKFQKFLPHHCKHVLLPKRAGLCAGRRQSPLPLQCMGKSVSRLLPILRERERERESIPRNGSLARIDL